MPSYQIISTLLVLKHKKALTDPNSFISNFLLQLLTHSLTFVPINDKTLSHITKNTVQVELLIIIIQNSQILKQNYNIKMSFYRSDSINFYKFILPRESAWEIMNTLGKTNLIHIVSNKSPLLQKPFLPQVRRCEESLQKIKNLQKVLDEKNISEPQPAYTKAVLAQLFKIWDQESKTNQKHSISMLDEIDRDVEQSWNYYFDLNKRIQSLVKKLTFYRENMAVMRAAQEQFGRKIFQGNLKKQEIQVGYFSDNSSVNFKIGVINAEQQLRLNRTIFRVTKGNCVTVSIPLSNIFENVIEEEKSKIVFFVLYPGKGQSILQRKLEKIIEAYSHDTYRLPSRESQFDKIMKFLQQSYTETENLLTMTESELGVFLHKMVDQTSPTNRFKKIQNMKLYLLKEKQIYFQLNEMELYNNFIQGEIYVRKCDVEELQRTLIDIERQYKLPAGQLVSIHPTSLPTHFIKNNYTSSAQQIVQTYGVPRYKEANPSFFTTVTFPFLFGVMFGDIAHGSILFAFGMYLILKKNTITNFLLKLFIPHRYLLSMMGFFAVYCGFIYNDFLSLSLNLFGSCYDLTGVNPGDPIPRRSSDCVYGFGLDPIWAVVKDNLNYTNSLKMKISVIIAVVHMTLGVFVKATNTLFYKRYLDFFCQFIPQLIFMVVLFGYMDFLIVFKWLQDWPDYGKNAPSIITVMIDLPLKLGKTENCCGGEPMWGTYQNTSQDTIQLVLLILAAISIPVMLLPKPLYLIYCKKKKAEDNLISELHDQQLIQQPKSQRRNSSQSSSVQEEEDASQIFVHQLIETIEYVLGCISNTASYLRLWALSLAHSQLSEVFFQKTVQPGIVKGYLGIPLMIVGFPMLAAATFAVLLCMDSMECFLHTLRLHWVQFQNKFYKGDGFSFVPYSFEKKIKLQTRQQQ